MTHLINAIRAVRLFTPVLVLALVAGASPARADAPSAHAGTRDATAAPPAAPTPSSADDALTAWQTKLRKAKERVSLAQSNEKIAARNYKRARTRRYPRGEALKALETELNETRSERTDAESDFSVTLEQARRAGVPMGVLGPYMDFEDEIQDSHPSDRDD